MAFAADVVGDDAVQRTSGEALWNTISYSVRPAFYSREFWKFSLILIVLFDCFFLMLHARIFQFYILPEHRYLCSPL